MNIVISGTQLASALAFLAGVATSGVALWTTVIRPVRRGLKFFSEFRDDWSGVPARPGVAGRDGMMVRMERVEHELTTNGGGSLRDAVSRTEVRVTRMERVIDQAHIINIPPPTAAPAGPSQLVSP